MPEIRMFDFVIDSMCSLPLNDYNSCVSSAYGQYYDTYGLLKVEAIIVVIIISQLEYFPYNIYSMTPAVTFQRKG